MPDPVSSSELRARLLAYCDERYREVRFRQEATGSSKRVAQGISAARALIESLAPPDDPQRYLRTLAEALEHEKERLRALDDEDGWLLGGIGTILQRIAVEIARR